MFLFKHRNYPEFVKKLFFDPKPKDPKGAVDLSIENFLKDKTVAPCKVRVYDASKFNISKAAGTIELMLTSWPLIDKHLVLLFSYP